MPDIRKNAVEVYKDGHREVYHRHAEPAKDGWAWTHPDTKEAREACSMCSDGTLYTVRAAARGEKG